MIALFTKKDKRALPWERSAEEALAKAPALMRSVIRRKVEAFARERKEPRVTAALFREARDAFMKSVGKDPSKAKDFMPAENRPGVPMVLVNACHGKAVGCRNALLDTDAWKGAVEDFVEKSGISEDLRRRVTGDTLFRHHKVSVSISGCPNGCSRPQIADFGITGKARPVFDLSACVSCGACGEACPDQAIRFKDGLPVWDESACQGCRACEDACQAGCITLEDFRARLASGGKLGRHPHLALPCGEFAEPAKALAVMEAQIRDYLKNAENGQRFAAFRAAKEREDHE